MHIIELEWGDEEGSTIMYEIEEVASEEGDTVEAAENVSPNEIASPNSAYEENIHDVRERRVRQPPVWTRDYVNGEGLSEEENELNMAMVASTDPLSFEEAVKSSKWRMTMDAEMKAI